MGLIDKVNVEVNGSGDLLSTLSTYTTKILKPNIVDGKNILTQAMINGKNTKYVIKYNYELLDTTLTIPQNVILEFDGGSIKNGTLVGNDTLMLNTNETESVLDNVTLDGTWKESSYDLVEEVVADKAPGDGMGRIILRKNKTFAEQLTQENTIYVIQYDFTLGEDITMPANCVLEFDGGSISGNNTLTLNNTVFNGNYDDSINVVLSGINITPNFRVGNTPSTNVAVSKLSTAYKGIFVTKNITLSDYVTVHSDMTIANDAIITCQSSIEYAIRLTSGVRVSGGSIVKQIEKIDARDTFRKNAFYALNVHNVIIENCNINGGIEFESTKSSADNEPNENIIIQNCRINADFTAIVDWVENPYGVENDILHFSGYSNVIIRNNSIKGLNNTRVFKITGIINGADYSTQYHTPKNIVIDNNIIDSTSCHKGSHQLLDAFCGTEKLIVTNNIIKARNHTHLFEQKSTQQNYPAQIIIEDNKINTNLDVLYVYMTPNDTLHFNRNIVDIVSGQYLVSYELLCVKDCSFYCKDNVFNGNGNLANDYATIAVQNQTSGQKFIKNVEFEGNILNNFGRVHLIAERVVCKNNVSDSQDAFCLRFNAKRLVYINNDVNSSYQICMLAGDFVLEYFLVFVKDNENMLCDGNYLTHQTIAQILDIVQGSQVKSNTTNMIYFGKS